MDASSAVRAARHGAQLSQRALALRASVPQSTVARIELGVLDPRSGTVDRLLGAAGCELVVERRPGAGVDRGQIRERLAMTPAQRIQENVAAAAQIARLRRRRR
jgi:transcriptional regulator with XRE-family HTH domain